jgi:hypothetical protein
MTEFRTEVRDRVLRAVTSLDEARNTGDDHMVEVRTGELESLARLATEHELHVPELTAYTEMKAG